LQQGPDSRVFEPVVCRPKSCGKNCLTPFLWPLRSQMTFFQSCKAAGLNAHSTDCLPGSHSTPPQLCSTPPSRLCSMPLADTCSTPAGMCSIVLHCAEFLQSAFHMNEDNWSPQNPQKNEILKQQQGQEHCDNNDACESLCFARSHPLMMRSTQTTTRTRATTTNDNNPPVGCTKNPHQQPATIKHVFALAMH
jgi:hypothetical protein